MAFIGTLISYYCGPGVGGGRGGVCWWEKDQSQGNGKKKNDQRAGAERIGCSGSSVERGNRKVKSE